MIELHFFFMARFFCISDMRKELTCLGVWISVTLCSTTQPFLAFMLVFYLLFTCANSELVKLWWFWECKAVPEVEVAI